MQKSQVLGSGQLTQQYLLVSFARKPLETVFQVGRPEREDNRRGAALGSITTRGWWNRGMLQYIPDMEKYPQNTITYLR
jgi:hypothetical protein